MRICRFEQLEKRGVGLYFDQFLVPIQDAAAAYERAHGERLELPDGDDLLPLLPPAGKDSATAARLARWCGTNADPIDAALRVSVDRVQLLVPVERPNKLFLLAGNYAAHIEEGGGVAAERAETFPYVFMKPPTTTLTPAGRPVTIPDVSPDAIDWELELAVIIGRGGKGIREQDALGHVAGYTVINDISDRRFRPNPERKEREKDKFFDWLHGKWHDSFCPCGPCVLSADSCSDPQKLTLQLRVNGELKQDATTAQQVFPVAAVIQFISSFVTLEPGDIISTGTPAGVGNTTGTYLQPGDNVEATIAEIGTLKTPLQSSAE